MSRVLYASVLGFGALLFALQARALVDVHQEIWFPSSQLIRIDRVAPIDSISYIELAFESEFGPLDARPGGRVTFSIAEKSAGAGSEALARYVIDPRQVVPLGVPAHVRAELRVYCDGQGRLHPTSASWNLSWCAPGTGARVAYGWDVGEGSLGVIGPTEGLGLTVRDENDVAGPGPTPDSAYRCSASAPASVSSLDLRPGTGMPRMLLEELASVGTGSIGIYFDDHGTKCSGAVPLGAPAVIYIVAHLEGISTCGLSGAEFRVDGLPQGWTALPQPASGAPITIGNPFQGGANIAFGQCQVGTDGAVLLYEVPVFPTTSVHDQYLTVRAHSRPSNPIFNCPLLTLCDLPMFNIVSVAGGQAILNPSREATCDKAVGVEAKSWSQVKGLFK
jgi:hypothetical protein